MPIMSYAMMKSWWWSCISR